MKLNADEETRRRRRFGGVNRHRGGDPGWVGERRVKRARTHGRFLRRLAGVDVFILVVFNDAVVASSGRRAGVVVQHRSVERRLAGSPERETDI